MTILTKPSVCAKQNPKVDAAVESGLIPDQDESTGNNDRLILIRHRARRMSSVSAVLLFLAGVSLMCMMILTGMIVYRRYQSEPIHFYGVCGIPYDSEYDEARNALNIINQKLSELSNQWDDSFTAEKLQSLFDYDNDQNDESHFNRTYFKEEFDLSFDEDVSKIYVPDFRDGRVGRFLHDFKSNQTAIIDETSNRCFVMPLDRETVLPPKSLADLISKMYSGYYDINTTAIRKNMRVVLPAIDEDEISTISAKIQGACTNMKVYRLEKLVSGVFKRSAEIPSHGKFGEWSGSVIEYDVHNIHELDNE